jgi:Kef-type K+ transport system membrane component KefB
MALPFIDILHICAALSALLMAAHLGGVAAARLGLPSMIGELCGGLLLGATALAQIWPDGYAWLMQAARSDTSTLSATATVLSSCGQLGVLLLMFTGGLQMRRLVTREDARAVGWISSLGVVVPVIVGIGLLQLIDITSYLGPANNEVALEIILLAALAVTSIPVITRIFMDLGLMESRLARIVLSVAVIEDVLLYIAVSVAIGMAQAETPSSASVPIYLGLKPDSFGYIVWHACVSLLLLAVATWGLGKRANESRAAVQPKLEPATKARMAGCAMAVLLGVTLLAMLLGLAPMFGALVAGIAASRATSTPWVEAYKLLESIGFAFFIPLYFALIGVSFDLFNAFDWKFTVGIVAIGTVVKYGGSYIGAYIAREPAAMANALAISVNARGGPGLILASTSFAAGIINEAAYTGLVVLAIATSVGAGVFLAGVLRGNPTAARMLRGQRSPTPLGADTAGADVAPTIVARESS